jgi:hypothetical protein
MHRTLSFLFIITLLLGGCYSKPVRHLASDASLIKPGQSTKKDVLLYLGEPDGHRTVSADTVEYVYFENKRGLLKKAPLVRSWTDADGYEMIIITMVNELVTNCDFRTFYEDDSAWKDDFTWDDLE